MLARARRWAALRGVRPLAADSPDGATVYATGVVRALDETVIGPLSGVECVVAWTKYWMRTMQTTFANGRPRPSTTELLRIVPFALETDDAQLIVDASHVRLLIPAAKLSDDRDRQHEFLVMHALHDTFGRFREIVVVAGQRVTVRGSVLREGIARPDGAVTFREARAATRLVGSRQHPIVIAAA